MKLTLRPEWRLWPFATFLGLLDIKTGVTIALLFALFNKVAGVYGLIAVATGSGGSFAQISLYIYSVIALVALGWGLRAVKEEDPKHTLYFAHGYFADHIFSTAWTIYFAVVWWFQTAHDGKRVVNSDSQLEIIRMTPYSGHPYTDEERVEAAMAIWNREKGSAFAVILISWLSKFYFALLIYSYASHLRKGTYRALPRSRHAPAPSVSSTYNTSLGLPDEDEEIEDFYRVPLRTPNTGNSISSFADFVNAPPGRTRKTKSALGRGTGLPAGADEEEEEVLFDDDELTYASSSRGHSKRGTDESSVGSSTDDDRKGLRPSSRNR